MTETDLPVPSFIKNTRASAEWPGNPSATSDIKEEQAQKGQKRRTRTQAVQGLVRKRWDTSKAGSADSAGRAWLWGKKTSQWTRNGRGDRKRQLSARTVSLRPCQQEATHSHWRLLSWERILSRERREEAEHVSPGNTHLKWSCNATLKSKASPRSTKPIPMNARRPGEQHPVNSTLLEAENTLLKGHPDPRVPFPSSMRITKYLLESVTLSTAVPGNWSTGAWAKSSPESTSWGEPRAPSLVFLPHCRAFSCQAPLAGRGRQAPLTLGFKPNPLLLKGRR